MESEESIQRIQDLRNQLQVLKSAMVNYEQKFNKKLEKRANIKEDIAKLKESWCERFTKVCVPWLLFIVAFLALIHPYFKS